MASHLKKLAANTTYVRPQATYQEKLSAAEIKKKLEGYEQVDDISQVDIGTHIRYFITGKDGEKVFRTGGFLHDRKNPREYVMISNGKVLWSVQVAGVVFFKKLSHKDEIHALREHYESLLHEKEQQIQELKSKIKSK